MRASVLRAIGWADDASGTTDGGQYRIVLGGDTVEYRVVRASRRSIGIRIGVTGVTVRAPRCASLRAIAAALRAHGPWVQRKLAVWQSRRRDIVPDRWIPGAPIAYLGRTLPLRLDVGGREAVTVGAAAFSITHPAPDDEAAVAAFARTWLRREARRVLAPEVADLARRIGAPVPPLVLSGARTRWGSCNAKGEIRLNARLVHLPPELARYVVAHEIAHLVHLDHSARFWTLVATLHERHREARRELAQWAAALEA